MSFEVDLVAMEVELVDAQLVHDQLDCQTWTVCVSSELTLTWKYGALLLSWPFSTHPAPFAGSLQPWLRPQETSAALQDLDLEVVVEESSVLELLWVLLTSHLRFP